jgi:hypothetical protein
MTGRSAVYDGMPTYSSLSGAVAAERERALREKARSAWKRRQRGEIKLRDAVEADAVALLRLARLESKRRPPEGRLIVAEDDGELVAAMAVESGAVIADPFKHTAEIVAMLEVRVRQLRTPQRSFGRFARVRRPRPAGGTA